MVVFGDRPSLTLRCCCDTGCGGRSGRDPQYARGSAAWHVLPGHMFHSVCHSPSHQPTGCCLGGGSWRRSAAPPSTLPAQCQRQGAAPVKSPGRLASSRRTAVRPEVLSWTLPPRGASQTCHLRTGGKFDPRAWLWTSNHHSHRTTSSHALRSTQMFSPPMRAQHLQTMLKVFVLTVAVLCLLAGASWLQDLDLLRCWHRPRRSPQASRSLCCAADGNKQL